jgi:hypothetical protein
VIGRDDFAILAEIAQRDEVPAHAGGADRDSFGFTKASREGELRVVVGFLIAEHQHRVLLERRPHIFIDVIVGGDLRQRHAANFSAKPGAWTLPERSDLHDKTP